MIENNLEPWKPKPQLIDNKDIVTPKYDTSDVLPKIVIKRSLTIRDFMSLIKQFPVVYPDVDFPVGMEDKINSLKEAHIIKDCNTLKSLGYTEIYFLEMAPGSTQITYTLTAEK